MPITEPITSEISTAGTATENVVRAATISRAIRLRPSESVPRKYIQPPSVVNGSETPRLRSWSLAASPISIGPKIATRVMKVRVTAATTASLSRQQQLPHADLAGTGAGALGLAGRLDGGGGFDHSGHRDQAFTVSRTRASSRA